MLKIQNLQKKFSKADFAKLAGVNKSSVTRGISSSLIDVDSSGSIDPMSQHNLQYLKEQIEKRLCDMPPHSKEHVALLKDYRFLQDLIINKRAADNSEMESIPNAGASDPGLDGYILELWDPVKLEVLEQLENVTHTLYVKDENLGYIKIAEYTFFPLGRMLFKFTSHPIVGELAFAFRNQLLITAFRDGESKNLEQVPLYVAVDADQFNEDDSEDEGDSE